MDGQFRSARRARLAENQGAGRLRDAERNQLPLPGLWIRGLSSLEVANVLGCCEIVVNNWLRRYEKEGLAGLKTRPGRKPKLSTQNPVHLETVKAEIAKHPQSVKTVVALLDEELDLAMHPLLGEPRSGI